MSHGAEFVPIFTTKRILLRSAQILTIADLYVAILFIVGQVINFMVFRSAPGLPVWLGGVLIIVGGVITTFWNNV